MRSRGAEQEELHTRAFANFSPLTSSFQMNGTARPECGQRASVSVFRRMCTYVRFNVFVHLCVVVKLHSRLTGVGVVQGVGM